MTPLQQIFFAWEVWSRKYMRAANGCEIYVDGRMHRGPNAQAHCAKWADACGAAFMAEVERLRSAGHEVSASAVYRSYC